MSSGNDGLSLSSARSIRDLPGPSALPLLGNSLQLNRQSMHQTLEQWSRKYGDIFRFRIASGPKHPRLLTRIPIPLCT